MATFKNKHCVLKIRQEQNYFTVMSGKNLNPEKVN
jgi:hypothetical protein